MNETFTLALYELSLWLLAEMEISKFVWFQGSLSPVSLRLQMVYPNTRLSWFTRQLDLYILYLYILYILIELYILGQKNIYTYLWLHTQKGKRVGR